MELAPQVHASDVCVVEHASEAHDSIVAAEFATPSKDELDAVVMNDDASTRQSNLPSSSDKRSKSERCASSHSSISKRLRLGESIDEVDLATLKLFSFVDCNASLRACRLLHLLRGCASIFRDSAGTGETFMLSESVRWINTFVSHNWSVHRYKKFAVLALYFNTWLAALSAGAIVLAAGAASFAGILPAVRDLDHGHLQAISSRLLSAPVWILSLLFGRQVLGCLRLWGPTVFLDKVCIPQTDPSAMKECIKRLAAFISHSSTVLIIYTDVYLKKLWTVYELAAAFTMHTPDRIVIIPTIMPLVMVFGMISIYVGDAMLIFMSHLKWYSYISNLVKLVSMYAGMLAMRAWSRQKAAIKTSLANFSVRDCICAFEGDRPLVYANIVTLMRVIHAVDEHASQEEALAVFDAMVREQLPTILEASIGRLALPYKYLCCMTFCIPFAGIVDRVATFGSWEEHTLRYAAESVNSTVAAFAGLPLIFAALDVSAGRFLGLRGWREQAWLACGLVLVSVLATVLFQILDILSRMAFGLDVGSGGGLASRGLLAYFVYCAILAVATLRTFSGRWRPWSKKPPRKLEHDRGRKAAAAVERDSVVCELGGGSEECN